VPAEDALGTGSHCLRMGKRQTQKLLACWRPDRSGFFIWTA